MLIENKIEIGHDSMFNIPQANFKSAHLLNKMALVQSQCSRTVAACAILFNSPVDKIRFVLIILVSILPKRCTARN